MKYWFKGRLERFEEVYTLHRTLQRNFFTCSTEVLDTAGRPCEHYQVVALGAGRSSCSKWLCYNGTMVHDCHAIVIARRALLRCKQYEKPSHGHDSYTFLFFRLCTSARSIWNKVIDIILQVSNLSFKLISFTSVLRNSLIYSIATW